MALKQRLDQALVARKLVTTRSQAESYIKLGKVLVNTKVVNKSGYSVDDADDIKLSASEQYVSRAALKLASVADVLHVDFQDKTMLDVGSSTGGFTDFALRRGAKKVIAVEVGTDQLHPSLRDDPRIELHEKTDIRNVRTMNEERRMEKESPALRSSFVVLRSTPDLVVIDVSFISLREILPSVLKLTNAQTEIIAMVKPQFEAGNSNLKHKGVIKNDRVRRDILKDFETWASKYFMIEDKADSLVAGAKGNHERFYKLRKL